MSKMTVSFYVLSDNKAQDFLGFIADLSQTALNKSAQSLCIIIEDEQLLSALDEALWAHTASSFIPHQRLTLNDLDSQAQSLDNNAPPSDKLSAPVLLGSYIPANFTGIVINTTARPVTTFINATYNAKVSRILEIIKPDTSSVKSGRDKYKQYKSLGYTLTHFQV